MFVIVELAQLQLHADGSLIGIPNSRSGFPYHAAGVIAQDGNDRITLEASAGSRDGTVRNQDGIYDIYTVGDATRSFHERHRAGFIQPVTIVIERPDDSMEIAQ